MTSALQIQSASDLSLPQLLRLALKKVAVDHLREHQETRVWLDEQPARLHGAIRELQRAYADQLPALRDIHFLDQGPFPYSRDIAVALEILQQSGAINRENPTFIRFAPRVFKDTKVKVTADIERLFPPGSSQREAFDAVVERLRGLATEE